MVPLKKVIQIIAVLLTLLVAPISASAISLNELTGEVYRYQFIGNYQGYYHYVDSKSVHNKGRDPRWWAKEEADIYVVDTSLKVIVKLPCKVNYTFGNYSGVVLDYHSAGVWDYSGNKIDVPKYRYVDVRNFRVQPKTAIDDIIQKIYHIEYGYYYVWIGK